MRGSGVRIADSRGVAGHDSGGLRVLDFVRVLDASKAVPFRAEERPRCPGALDQPWRPSRSSERPTAACNASDRDCAARFVFCDPFCGRCGASERVGRGSRILRRLSELRHASLLPSPLEAARASRSTVVRVAYAPPFRRRRTRVRGQRALVGHDLRDGGRAYIPRLGSPTPAKTQAGKSSVSGGEGIGGYLSGMRVSSGAYPVIRSTQCPRWLNRLSSLATAAHSAVGLTSRLVLAVVAAFGLCSAGPASSGSNHAGGLVPSRLTARSSVTRHFEYIFDAGGIQVYDIDHRNRYLGQIAFPSLPIRGLVADPATATLFVAYGGPGGSAGTGSMLAYDLVSGRTLWRRNYATGSTTSRSRRTAGRSTWPSGKHPAAATWEIVDAANGRITGSIQGGSGPHETIVGPDGKYVYLGGVNTPYLEIGSTSTGRIVRKIGPLYGPGVRPFTINATQTLAFTTSWNFLGFQVSSIKTGKVLYSVSPPGFRFDAAAFGSHPRPRHLALPGRTSALPDRHAERVRACLRRQRPPASCPP